MFWPQTSLPLTGVDVLTTDIITIDWCRCLDHRHHYYWLVMMFWPQTSLLLTGGYVLTIDIIIIDCCRCSDHRHHYYYLVGMFWPQTSLLLTAVDVVITDIIAIDLWESTMLEWIYHFWRIQGLVKDLLFLVICSNQK